MTDLKISPSINAIRPERPTDPASIAIAATILMSVALLASYLPASRASRLDPAAVLRE